MISRRASFRLAAVLFGLFLIYALYYAWQIVEIGSAYKAKVLCSGVFVSGRTPEVLFNEDLDGILRFLDTEIDFDHQAVTASFLGAADHRAIFRDGFGCTLLAGTPEEDVRQQTSGIDVKALKASALHDAFAGFAGPESSREQRASRKLQQVVDQAFIETDPQRPIRTRAVIVVHDGRIAAERYAEGISALTPLTGWSMAKSVTSALIGVLVKQGRLSIDEPVALAEWSSDADPRKTITLDHLLRMSSGLEFDERSGPIVSDVNLMLLRNHDAAAYAAAKPLRDEPGSRWQYSSGTTNILSRLIRNSVDGDLNDYLTFPRRALFNKIGMHSAVMELDASGTFVGSSFMYATARDWARFGLLYLYDGVWEGERILPAGWAAYSATPTPAAPNGRYGAHFWLKGIIPTTDPIDPNPRIPTDTFYAAGFEGQYVVIIPSRKLVIVRLGQTKDYSAWNMEDFVVQVLAAMSS